MNWKNVFNLMNDLAEIKSVSSDPSIPFWKYGQEKTIRWIANQLGKQNRNGVLIADEVGMGKTRVVMAAILAVLENGGTVAAVVPPGLLYQWNKEWDDFINNLDDKKGFSPILLRSYYNFFENSTLNFPLSKNNKNWLIISHRFGPPRLSYNSKSYRYLLPVLAKALQIKDKGGHKGNSYWQLSKIWYPDDDCIGANCSKCENKCENSWFPQMNKAASILKKAKYNRLFNDIPNRGLENEINKEKFKQWFNSDNGLKMLGELLGPVDLVVIDEAHKNRGENSSLENIFRIMKKNENVKYIAMTATPMELEPTQWEKIFDRICEPYPHKVVEDFVNAYHNANKMPENRNQINRLIETSRKFAEMLSPYVTRRLRIKQEDMRYILGLQMENNENSAHPHRHWGRIDVGFNEVDADWKPSLYSFEAIGKAAKGCSTDNVKLNEILSKLKIADSRYASGQIYYTCNSESVSDEDELEMAIKDYLRDQSDKDLNTQKEYMIGKLHRIKYWWGISKKNINNISGHPRIQIVADEIEKIIWSVNAKRINEKILVFGTFKKPMRDLWNVLNRRAVLRFLDRKTSGDKKEPPIPAAGVCLKNLDYIWDEYERLKLKKDIGLTRKFNTKLDLKKAIEGGERSYKSIRNRLTNHINNKFINSLPGNAAIRTLKYDLQDLIRARLINEMIYRGDKTENLRPKEIKMRALKIWTEYIESYFDLEDESTIDNESKSIWKIPDYFEGNDEQIKIINELNDFANNLGENYLYELIEDERDHISGHLGFFARILDGDVKMETRRVLQSQFNNKYSFPRVLIAQSQVGREGLNLHKSCRIIVQFHSEWNPGVIEQQIGRVDRIESYWEELAREYNRKFPEKTVDSKGYPKIQIYPVIFNGTYDDFQYQVSKKRRDTLNAHLFGQLLNEEALLKMPQNQDWDELKQKLIDAAPDFSPPEDKN